MCIRDGVEEGARKYVSDRKMKHISKIAAAAGGIALALLRLELQQCEPVRIFDGAATC
jgi:hypothetical protein